MLSWKLGILTGCWWRGGRGGACITRVEQRLPLGQASRSLRMTIWGKGKRDERTKAHNNVRSSRESNCARRLSRGRGRAVECSSVGTTLALWITSNRPFAFQNACVSF